MSMEVMKMDSRRSFSGHLECAQALIEANAAVDEVNNLGNTALLLACFSGHHECAQALIDAGAAVDEVNNQVNTVCGSNRYP
jgi:ankyrin repeat protein